MLRNETGAMNAFKINNTDNRSKSTLLWPLYYQMLKSFQDSFSVFVHQEKKTKNKKNKTKTKMQSQLCQ